MKKILILTVCMLLALGPIATGAEAVKPALSDLNKTSIQELLKIKVSMDTVIQLQKDNVLDAKTAQARLEVYLKQASQVAGQNVTLLELAKQNAELEASLESQRLTVLQRAAGFVTFTNIILTLGAILVAYCLSFLFPLWIKLFRLIFDLIPAEVYELLMYVASVALMAANRWCTNGLEQYIALTGALLLGGALGVTTVRHEYWINYLQIGPVKYSGFLFVVWGAVAYATLNPFIGFMSVAALMSLLGFSVWIFPFCYCVGFKDKEAVGRGTAAALIVLAAFVYMKIAGVTDPGIKVFEEGALFLGSFVGYLGLLISSSKWYDRHNPSRYLFAQVVTLIAGVLALFFGATFGIGELLKIGGTFFVLWALEKLLEIMPSDREAFAYVGLFIGGLIFAFGWFVKTHAALVGPFLLFM